MTYTVVIPAAGEGKRMNAGKNKLLLELDGRPLIVHTLSVFQRDEECEGIIVVTNPTEKRAMGSFISRFGISKVKQIVPGGAKRQSSVYEGLKACEHEGIVLIHDGARPFVTFPIIQRLIAESEKNGAAIPAVPLKDTVKRAKDGIVTETLERSSLWAVQTPQAFRLSLIKKAHELAEVDGVTATDDASLLERTGFPVSIVASDFDNIKITTPDDLVTAQAILAKRRREKR